MNALGQVLARHIAATGPMTVAEYMSTALGHPEHGYYRRSDPLGVAGDFTTSPEISQIFGELIGAWLIDTWDKIGRPKPVRLVELGPGRGTLMADALRIGRLAPGWLDAVDLHLVEINPALRREQAERLSPYSPAWHESFDTVPDGPLLAVANEFFDALPIRQLVAVGGRWHERMVGWSDALGFHFLTAPTPSPLSALLPAGVAAEPDGNIVELCPAAIGIVTQVARRIAENGGAALLIDYGRMETVPGDTLQAVRAHAHAPVLESPGDADLSAHVDFGALSRAAMQAGAITFGPTGQGPFLAALGIQERADRLKNGAEPSYAATIDRAVARLTGSEAMGTLFKVLAISPPGLLPAGFPDPETDPE